MILFFSRGGGERYVSHSKKESQQREPAPLKRWYILKNLFVLIKKNGRRGGGWPDEPQAYVVLCR
jgi:hypothetical protein